MPLHSCQNTVYLRYVEVSARTILIIGSNLALDRGIVALELFGLLPFPKAHRALDRHYGRLMHGIVAAVVAGEVCVTASSVDDIMTCLGLLRHSALRVIISATAAELVVTCDL